MSLSLFFFILGLSMPMSVFADVFSRQPTNVCGVTISPSESPACTPNATNSNTNSMNFNIGLTADGNPHDVAYSYWSYFCTSGQFQTCGPNRCCLDNQQNVNATIHLNPNQTLTIPLSRSSTSGTNCGTYQFDFNINSVNGNTGCTYGQNVNNVGTTSICKTNAVCPAAIQISGNVYLDYNNNGTNNANYTSVATVTVKTTNGTVVGTDTTDANGNYSIPNLPLNTTYTVTLTVPAGYKLNTTTTNPQTVNTTSTVNFGLTPLLGISGNVFVDDNNDGFSNNGEATYTGGNSTVNISGPVSMTLSNATGAFNSGLQLTPGTYTISYTSSVPAGYYLTYPLNGPPPSFTVQIGQNGICTTNGANGAICTNGSISNLNYGLNNKTPWYQSVCGDVRINSGITDMIPPAPTCGTTTGAYMIQPSAGVCTNPGLAFSGSTTPNFGTSGGKASTAPYNWTVGTTQYPSIVKTGTSIHTSYAYLLAKMRQSGITPVDLATKCTLSNCNLPPTLPHGLYQANGNVNLQTFTFPGAQDYVFLINGDVTISGNISIPVGSTALFSSAGNIYVANTVGSAATSSTSNVDGFYSADKSFIINSTGTCPDLRLNIAGSVVLNAGLKGGSLTNNRDLCTNNTQCPALSITQRPDFLVNAPTFLKYANHIWQELAPGTVITTAPTPTIFVPTVSPTPVITASPTVTPTPTQPPYFAQDTFQRSNQAGWGTASDGHIWGTDATGSTFSISNNTGKQTNGSGVTYTGTLGSTVQNVDVLVTGSLTTFSGSPAPNFGLVVRYTDANNWYKAYIDGGTFYIQEKVGGASTNLATVAFPASSGTAYSIRFQAVGTTLNAKVWQANQSEPVSWTLSTTDTSLSSGNVGVRILTTGSAIATITSFQATLMSFSTPTPTLSPIPTPTTTYVCSSSSNQQCNWSSSESCSISNQICYCNDPKFGGHDEQYQCVSGSWAYQKDVTSVCSASTCKN